jgi:ribulose-phosphate 3-epimerase
MHEIKIAPSILSADLLQLEKQIREVEENNADFIHVDVMDGQFVPNITFGPVIIRTLKRITNLPLDVHLMMYNADRYIEEFATAGAQIITVHQETLPNLHRAVQIIRENGCQPGVSINPATDASVLTPILAEIDLILIMSVNPGFGGQKFLSLAVDKLQKLSAWRKNNNFNYMIEVDGGINHDTLPLAVKAGADVLVAGDAIFGSSHPGKSCRELKQLAQEIRAKHG